MMNSRAMRLILPFLLAICAEVGFTYVPMAFNKDVFEVASITAVLGLHFCGIEYINMLKVKNNVAGTMHIVRTTGNAMAIPCWNTMIFQSGWCVLHNVTPSLSPADAP